MKHLEGEGYLKYKFDISGKLLSFSDISSYIRPLKYSPDISTISSTRIVTLGEDNPRYVDNVLENVLKYDISKEWLDSLHKYGILNPIPGFWVELKYKNSEVYRKVFVAVDGFRRLVGILLLDLLYPEDNIIEKYTLPVYELTTEIDWQSPKVLEILLDLQDVIHVRKNFKENSRFSRLRSLLLRGKKQKDIASQLGMTASQVSMWKKAALDDDMYAKVIYENKAVDRVLKERKELDKQQEVKEAQQIVDNTNSPTNSDIYQEHLSSITENAKEDLQIIESTAVDPSILTHIINLPTLSNACIIDDQVVNDLFDLVSKDKLMFKQLLEDLRETYNLEVIYNKLKNERKK